MANDLHRATGHEVLPGEALAHKAAYFGSKDLFLFSGIQDLDVLALVAQASNLLLLPTRVDPDEVRSPFGHVVTDEAGILDG